MQQQNLRKTHKVNIIATWVCAMVLTVLSYLQNGLTVQFYSTVTTMVGTSILISGLNLIRFNDVVKGCIIVCAIGLATLLCSILQGASDRNFIASFFVLALATLYFRSTIILWYGVVYLGACVVATAVNPAYIDGVSYERARVLIKLVIYAAVTAVLYIATRKGERMVRESEKAAAALAASAQRMEETSRNLTRALDISSEAMGTLSSETALISGSATEMAHRIHSTMDAANQLQLAAQTVSASMAESRAHMESLGERFSQVNQCVNQGLGQMGKTQAAMDQAESAVSSARQATGTLLEQMGQIRQMLRQIEEVASQTNLLSLNASIEAARAGEAGKGFAVVADEVRALAGRSAQVAAQIQSVVNSLSGATQDVYTHVDGGSSATRLGMASLKDLGDELGATVRAAQAAQGIMQEQFAHLGMADSSATRMQGEVERIVQYARENADGVEQIAAAIEEQNASAEELSAQLGELASMSKGLCGQGGES